jgi:hypothetical protein
MSNRKVLGSLVPPLVAMTLLGSGGCADLADPAEERRALASASLVRIDAVLDGDPAGFTLTDPAVIAELAQALETEGPTRPTPEARVSTMDFIRVTIPGSQGQADRSFSVIGQQLRFGSEGGSMVRLRDRELLLAIDRLARASRAEDEQAPGVP